MIIKYYLITKKLNLIIITLIIKMNYFYCYYFIIITTVHSESALIEIMKYYQMTLITFIFIINFIAYSKFIISKFQLFVIDPTNQLFLNVIKTLLIMYLINLSVFIIIAMYFNATLSLTLSINLNFMIIIMIFIGLITIVDYSKLVLMLLK